jgi:hypothetical protein
VTGHAIKTYRLEASEVSLPDPALPGFRLFAPLSDGGFDIQDASVMDDGGFSFPLAPAGEYYVDTGGGAFVVSSARTLNLDDPNGLGRPNLSQNFPASVPVSMTMTGLRPTTLSNLDLSTPNVGAWGTIYFDMPPPGPQVTAATATLSGFGHVPDGTAGDHSWINEVEDCTQLADGGVLSLPDGGPYFYCYAYGPSAQLTALTINPAGGTTVTADLAPGLSMQLTATFSPASFLAHLSEAFPQGTDLGADLQVVPTPGAPGLTPRWAGYSGTLLDVSPGPLATDLPVSVGYSDVFPQTWARLALWGYSVETPTLLPNTMFGHTDANMTEQRPLSAMPSTLTLRLGPPTQLTVDGSPAAVAAQLSSPTPTIAWNAPTLGAPTLYSGTVLSLQAVMGATQKTTVVSFVTKGTRFRVPAGLLTRNGDYVVRVSAVFGPGLDFDRQPLEWPTAVDASLSDTVSAIWHLP